MGWVKIIIIFFFYKKNFIFIFSTQHLGVLETFKA